MEPVVKSSGAFKWYFLYGILFELLLLLSWFLPSTSLAIEISNFVVITHYPLMVLVEIVAGSDAGSLVPALCLLIAGLAMASVWGGAFWLIRCLIQKLSVRLNRRGKLAFRLIAGVLTLFLLVMAFISGLPQTPTPFKSSSELEAVVAGNNAFALDLYQKLKEQPGNLFLSSFSISTSLAMVSAGAHGQTEAEITNVCHLNLPPEKLHPAFAALITRMDHVQRWNRITLKLADSLWCQRDYQFEDGFLNIVGKDYFTEARAVDFRNAAGSANEINQWIGTKTNHKIPGAIKAEQFDQYTRLVLCDAIYFKGMWLRQFKPGDTKPFPFHVTTNETVMVPMMFQHGKFKTTVTQDGSVQLLELPYSGNDLSMVIVMPTPFDYMPNGGHYDLSDLEEKVTPGNLSAWLSQLDARVPDKTSISLPRFTTASSFDLKDKLKALGIILAFSDQADFHGMDGSTNLYLSDVLHKAFVEVNETGAEAAAMTLEENRVRSMSERFIVDRPFIFLIRDNGSGSILFLGRMIDPTK